MYMQCIMSTTICKHVHCTYTINHMESVDTLYTHIRLIIRQAIMCSVCAKHGQWSLKYADLNQWNTYLYNVKHIVVVNIIHCPKIRAAS